MHHRVLCRHTLQRAEQRSSFIGTLNKSTFSSSALQGPRFQSKARKPLSILLLAGSSFAFLSLSSERSLLSFDTPPDNVVVHTKSPATLNFVEAIRKEEALFDQAQYQELHSFLALLEYNLDALCSTDKQKADILWRYARACYKLKDLPEYTKDASALVRQAYDLVSRAVALDPTNFACHKWAGITLSSSDYQKSTKEGIASAYIVQDHFLNAIKANPLDPTSRHLLGRWCFYFADMSWYMRKIAAALFADPPTSTYEEALSHFIKAEEIEPEFYTWNLLMLGKCYSCLASAESDASKKDEFNRLAKYYFTRCVNQKISNQDDQNAVDEAKAAIGA